MIGQPINVEMYYCYTLTININDYIDILATDKIPGTRNNIPLHKT